MTELKRRRRVPLGDLVTLLFERATELTQATHDELLGDLRYGG